MSTDDGDWSVGRVCSHNTRYKTCSADDIKRRYAEDSSWVVNSSLLKNGRNYWNGRIDRVGDDEDVSLWGDAGDSGSKVADNGSIGLPEFHQAMSK